MHELSIVEALVEQVRSEVDRSGREGTIRRVELVIGRLSGVSCDSIRFAFDLLKRDTPLAESDLQIAEPLATCHCRSCNARVEVDEIVLSCPECGGGNITIEGGRELLLQSIEIEE